MSRHMMWLPLLASLILQICLAEQGKDAQPKRLYDFGLGKRAAYTYVSEYKRLPIYNFGLGKRYDDSMLSGYPLGRQNDLDQEDYDEDGLKDSEYKRMKQYSFGLGKRLPTKQYSFGLGKRVPYDEPELNPDSFLDMATEEEKRSNPSSNGHRFSFGLGKRDAGKQDLRRSMQYNFGLGKRSQANTNFAV